MDKDEEMHETQKDVLTAIKNSYKEGRLIPFIGAGFSENISQEFSWDKVLEKMQGHVDSEIGSGKIKITELRQQKKQEISTAEIMELVIWALGKEKKGTRKSRFNYGKEVLQRILDSILRAFEYDPPKMDLHRELIRHFNRIYTTNWDRAIEWVCDEKKKKYHKIYSVESKLIIDDGRGNVLEVTKEDTEHIKDINEIRNAEQIMKIHGDSAAKYEGKSLVASETDFVERIADFESGKNIIDSYLFDDLKHNDFLFIGYSFSDPNIKYILTQLKTILNKGDYIFNEPPKLYWVSKLNEKSEYIIKHLKDFYADWKMIEFYPLLKNEREEIMVLLTEI